MGLTVLSWNFFSNLSPLDVYDFNHRRELNFAYLSYYWVINY